MSSKLREALEELIKFTCGSCERRFCEDDAEEEDGVRVPSYCSVIIKARAALAEPIRNCDVDNSKIKSESDFEKTFNLHKVSRCCSMCRYGEDEVGCTCTCSHPYRNDNGNYCDPDLPRNTISNTMQNCVCDLFEERI